MTSKRDYKHFVEDGPTSFLHHHASTLRTSCSNDLSHYLSQCRPERKRMLRRATPSCRIEFYLLIEIYSFSVIKDILVVGGDPFPVARDSPDFETCV